MFYYNYKGANLVSLNPMEGFGPETAPVTQGRLFAPVAGDPVLGRGSFRVNHPGQLANPHGLEVLDASRLPQVEVDEATAAAIAEIGSACGIVFTLPRTTISAISADCVPMRRTSVTIFRAEETVRRSFATGC